MFLRIQIMCEEEVCVHPRPAENMKKTLQNPSKIFKNPSKNTPRPVPNVKKTPQITNNRPESNQERVHERKSAKMCENTTQKPSKRRGLICVCGLRVALSALT